MQHDPATRVADFEFGDLLPEHLAAIDAMQDEHEEPFWYEANIEPIEPVPLYRLVRRPRGRAPGRRPRSSSAHKATKASSSDGDPDPEPGPRLLLPSTIDPAVRAAALAPLARAIAAQVLAELFPEREGQE
jgi:hypothetical protein